LEIPKSWHNIDGGDGGLVFEVDTIVQRERQLYGRQNRIVI